MSDAKTRLFIVATEATSITGALESLRNNRLDRALEALEQQLDTATVMLSGLVEEIVSPDQERAVETLRFIRDYRRVYPRRSEVDMSKFEQPLVQDVRKLQEHARRILEEIK